MKKRHAIYLAVFVNLLMVAIQLRNTTLGKPLIFRWSIAEFLVFLVPYALLQYGISVVLLQNVLALLLVTCKKHRASIAHAFEDMLFPCGAISLVFSFIFVALKACGA